MVQKGIHTKEIWTFVQYKGDVVTNVRPRTNNRGLRIEQHVWFIDVLHKMCSIWYVLFCLTLLSPVLALCQGEARIEVRHGPVLLPILTRGLPHLHTAHMIRHPTPSIYIHIHIVGAPPLPITSPLINVHHLPIAT